MSHEERTFNVLILAFKTLSFFFGGGEDGKLHTRKHGHPKMGCVSMLDMDTPPTRLPARPQHVRPKNKIRKLFYKLITLIICLIFSNC